MKNNIRLNIDKMLLVSVGPLMGDAIKMIQDHEPLSPLFNTRYQEEERA